MINYIHVLHTYTMYKIDRRGGGSKNRSLGNYQLVSNILQPIEYKLIAGALQVPKIVL